LVRGRRSDGAGRVGGGIGNPAERSREAIMSDIAEGYVSEEAARLDYPHAFE